MSPDGDSQEDGLGNWGRTYVVYADIWRGGLGSEGAVGFQFVVFFSFSRVRGGC